MVVMLFAKKRRKTLSSGRFAPGARFSGASKEQAVYEFLGHPGSGGRLDSGSHPAASPVAVAGSRGVRIQDVGFLPVTTSNFHAA
jgi:hypothetical protein